MRLSGRAGAMPCLFANPAGLTPCELFTSSALCMLQMPLHVTTQVAAWQPAGGCMATSRLGACQQQVSCPEGQVRPVTHRATAMWQADGCSGPVSRACPPREEGMVLQDTEEPGHSRQVKDTGNQLSRALTHKRSQGSEVTGMRTIAADMTAQPLAPGGAWAATPAKGKTQPACVRGVNCSQRRLLISEM